jgi:hypothetical protein
MQDEIAKLPPENFRQLAEWNAERRAAEWDLELEDAARTGKLGNLWHQATKEMAAGKARPLHELLDE